MFENVSESDLEAGRLALAGGSVGARLDLVVDHGEGAVLYTKDGNQYIDCTSQAWSLNIGYARPEIAAAVSEVMNDYMHIRTSFETIPKLLLTKKLAEITAQSLNQVAYTLTGSDANEGAVKLALRNSQSDVMASLWDGYHGRTMTTISLSWPHPNNRFTAWGGPVLRVPQAYCYRCPFGLSYPSCDLACVDFAKETILKAPDELPAALIMEPIQGNGGMINFPPDYYPAIREMCNELGILLIWDEIQTGFGRVGAWTASDLYKTVPDIIILGKALGGGFPLYATIYNDELNGFEPGDHSFTFGHFPLSMVAALVNIQIIEDEGLLDRSKDMGEIITGRLEELQNQYEMIGDIRGPGLMIGVELVYDRDTKEPACKEAEEFISEGLKRGVIFGESRYLGLGNIVKIKPPLVITEGEIDRVLAVFEEIIQIFSSRKN